MLENFKNVKVIAKVNSKWININIDENGKVSKGRKDLGDIKLLKESMTLLTLNSYIKKHSILATEETILKVLKVEKVYVVLSNSKPKLSVESKVKSKPSKERPSEYYLGETDEEKEFYKEYWFDYNETCKKCSDKCKQSWKAEIVCCDDYMPNDLKE